MPIINPDNKSVEYDLYKILNEDSATVIDVRTEAEFVSGNVKNSINIPVDKIVDSVDKIRKSERPIVLCCASGGRSSVAVEYLNNLGIKNIYDGGSWKNVEMQLIGK